MLNLPDPRTWDPHISITMPDHIAALPKADIHIHAEWAARLDRVLARREGRPPFDYRAWATGIMADNPPGHQRLRYVSSQVPEGVTEEIDAEPENFIARLVDLLGEAARDGAVLVEVRFGKDFLYRPDMMDLFREAERRVQQDFPRFHAAAIPVVVTMRPDAQDQVRDYLHLGEKGVIHGVDFLHSPYHTEADWSQVEIWVRRFADAGLGVTIHAGEVSTANIAAVAQLPGVSRIGHATHAIHDPHLMDLLVEKNITMESSITCNVIFGAALSYGAHPIRRFIDHGIKVALCTDDPVQVSTTIGREYAVAHALGLSEDELLKCTRNAINAAFIAPHTRAAILDQLDGPPELG